MLPVASPRFGTQFHPIYYNTKASGDRLSEEALKTLCEDIAQANPGVQVSLNLRQTSETRFVYRNNGPGRDDLHIESTVRAVPEKTRATITTRVLPPYSRNGKAADMLFQADDAIVKRLRTFDRQVGPRDVSTLPVWVRPAAKPAP